MDHLSRTDRSRNMRKIRSAGTRPEKILGRVLRKAGYRVSGHTKSVFGRPDYVLRKQKIAIFLHGCYWHRHSCRRGRSMPSTNRTFWVEKFLRNKKRDKLVKKTLLARGWRVLVVWECQLHNISNIKERLTVLSSPEGGGHIGADSNGEGSKSCGPKAVKDEERA